MNNLTEKEKKSYACSPLLPPPGDEVVREHLVTISKLRGDQTLLRKSLNAVMTWINNWSPDFTMDPDWEADRDKALKALEETA